MEGRFFVNHGRLPPVRRGGSKYNPASLSRAAPGWDIIVNKGKGKSVPLQAWSCPEVSRKLIFPDFKTTAQDGGKVVSLTHRPPLPPGNTPGTHFC